MSNNCNTTIIETRADYDATKAINQSGLKVLVGQSPAHYQAYLSAPHKETPAMKMGSHIHCAVLEPELLASKFTAAPEGIDKRTKEGKAMWAEIQTLANGRTILSAEESLEGLTIAKHAREFIAQRGIKFTKTEFMFACTWEGIRLKAAIDALGEDGYLYDLKTTEDASPAGILSSVRKYRYNLQAAFYRFAYEIAFGVRPAGFRFIFIEKTPPFAAMVVEVGPELMSYAGSDLLRGLDLYRNCSATDVWPGYAEDVQVIDIKASTAATPINFA